MGFLHLVALNLSLLQSLLYSLNGTLERRILLLKLCVLPRHLLQIVVMIGELRIDGAQHLLLHLKCLLNFVQLVILGLHLHGSLLLIEVQLTKQLLVNGLVVAFQTLDLLVPRGDHILEFLCLLLEFLLLKFNNFLHLLVHFLLGLLLGKFDGLLRVHLGILQDLLGLSLGLLQSLGNFGLHGELKLGLRVHWKILRRAIVVRQGSRGRVFIGGRFSFRRWCGGGCCCGGGFFGNGLGGRSLGGSSLVGSSLVGRSLVGRSLSGSNIIGQESTLVKILTTTRRNHARMLRAEHVFSITLTLDHLV
mmetsp:Transcript_15562/g.32067  ORF Transcript_15562/g.32067 Transcript_15562/m.32067 type:complete len:305 (-) Transcript_15562:271-1185(-)